MPLLLGQLVYTSFPGVGFRVLASTQVPSEIQQAFIHKVVYQHWDSHNPPKSGYRAAYIHQVTLEHTLFGWLYNDGPDDLGRSHVPYFVCYCYSGLVDAVQLENILTCLHRGPVALIDRHSLPSALETVVAPDLWSYQPARIGVAISLGVRKRSHVALKHRRLLEVFIPVNERKMVTQHEHSEQQEANFSIYTSYLVGSNETGATDLNRDTAAMSAEALKPYQEYKEQLQRYEQPFVQEFQRDPPISDNNPADRNKRLLLGVSIAMGLAAVVGVLYAYFQLQAIKTLKTEAKYQECMTTAELESWAADTLLYSDAQGLLNECRLEQAKMLASSEQFSAAIKAAEKIPENSPLYPEAQKLIRNWSEI